MSNKYVRFIPAENMTLRKNQDGETLATIGGETILVGHVMSAFPISNKSHFVSLRDHAGQEIGIVEQAHELDHESKSILREEVEKSYFLPKIQEILAVEDHLNLFTFRVQTDKGYRAFEVRNPRRNIRSVGNDRFLIRDVDGNRYDIPRLRYLSPRSQSLMREFV